MPTRNVGEFIATLKASPLLGQQIVHHELLPERPPRYAEPATSWHPHVDRALASVGIDTLYAHQVEAVDRVRAGLDTVVATPTASGKTLVYNLPVLDKAAHDPNARALYLFPLKALAQDQLRSLNELTASWPRETRPSAAIYDGDTSSYKRTKIRQNPPNILLSNPEMLHLSILPHHEQWAGLLTNLKYVVVDEAHTYRGVMGSNMAWVFRRFKRICHHYGADPTFVFSTATLGNPSELTGQLTGRDVGVVEKSGAPTGARHFIFLNPLEGAARAAIQLLQDALPRELRTIVYTQSRKMTELIALWAGENCKTFASRISAYRAGFLPEERREIEARLASGELLAVVSTSALELGIDIGSLDLCLLVGYPGSIMATWQRGGRVGRSLRESAMVLLGHEDALDQYFMANPAKFFSLPPESAVCNPYNPVIMDRHLCCAAADLALRSEEPLLGEPEVADGIRRLEGKGKLLLTADGKQIFSSRKAPQRMVNLRGAGQPLAIVDTATNARIGEIDDYRAFKETHPGAIYLHRGSTFRVEDLHIEARTVTAQKAKVNYFTRVRTEKSTEVLEITGAKTLYRTSVYLGRLRVTENVTGYARYLVRGHKCIGVEPLDLPPLVFETEGIWLEIPDVVRENLETARLHFMGGIHAVEHAAIGILPLVILTDRSDLGGISIPFHPQLGTAAVFVYDGVPGGVGLARQAFARARELMDRTLELLRSCPCELGCPACVHSPKCGSGNRPIAKDAALAVMQHLVRGEADEKPLPIPKQEKTSKPQSRGLPTRTDRFAVLDIETRRSAAEVGGWHCADKMGVSCAVLFDAANDRFHDYLEQDIPALIEDLKRYELVVGFNIKRFDYKVLSGYTRENLLALPTLDILEEVKNRLGYRLSLDHLAAATLNAVKIGDGLQALKWWQQGRIDDILRYCRKDVALTRDLFLFGRKQGHLLFRNKAGSLVRLPVAW